MYVLASWCRYHALFIGLHLCPRKFWCQADTKQNLASLNRKIKRLAFFIHTGYRLAWIRCYGGDDSPQMCPHSFYIIYLWYYHVFLKKVNYFSDPKLWSFPVFQDGAKLVSKDCFSRGEIKLRNFCYCLVSSRFSLVRIQNNGWHGNVGQLLVPVTESIYFVEWNGNGFLNKRHPLENLLWKKILAFIALI